MYRRGFLTGLAGVTGALSLPQIAHGRDVVSANLLAEPLQSTQSALGLRLMDASGARLFLADYSDHLLVVNFWGPWCPPCRREMPSLSRLAKRLEGTLVKVLPVAFDRLGAGRVQRFFDQMSIDNLPVIMGDGQNLYDTLGLEMLPSTAIVTQTGDHIATVAGEAIWDDDATFQWLTTLAKTEQP